MNLERNARSGGFGTVPRLYVQAAIHVASVNIVVRNTTLVVRDGLERIPFSSGEVQAIQDGRLRQAEFNQVVESDKG